MSERRRGTVCGWCPTELPDGDSFEMAVHFSTKHGIHDGSHSARYFYPDDIGEEFERWERLSASSPAVAGSRDGGDGRE